CFSDNDYSTSLPWNIEFFHSCDGIKLPLLAGMAVSHDPLGRIAQAQHGQSPQLGHGDAPKPELTFDQLPGGAEAPVRPAIDVFAGLQIGGYETPQLPADVGIPDRRPLSLGVAGGGGFWPGWCGAVLWWCARGGAWALWNLWRSERSMVARVVWTVPIVLIPFFGVLAYVLAGNTGIRPGRRLLVGLGGFGVYLVVVVASLLVGKIL